VDRDEDQAALMGTISPLQALGHSDA